MEKTVNDTPKEMVADAYLTRLGERGIEYVFANAGTDFAPIVESLARNVGNKKFPRFITVPHENVAMAMAHGYYRTAGKPAAVMVHVTVGTANAICGLMNAARDNVPVLLAAGRTPITETGHMASRNRSIHWGQEAFDQGGMVREFVKWDYELREGQPVDAIVDRALDISMSEPRGPVYLTLPREVLANPAVARAAQHGAAARGHPARSHARRDRGSRRPDRQGRVSADRDVKRRPQPGRHRRAGSAGARNSPSRWCRPRPVTTTCPPSHPMNLGFETGPWLGKADVIVVLDSVVPWIPRTLLPDKNAKIIHISPDPLSSRYPFRDIEADMLITGDAAAALRLLRECLAGSPKAKNGAADSRRKTVTAARDEMAAKRKKLIETVKDQTPVHPAWLAHCVNQLKAKDAIVVSELGVPLSLLDMTEPRSFMGNLLSGGLGFGLGAALGAKLAAPRARGDRDRRRRLLHVRQSPALSLCRRRRKAADADHRAQQHDVGRRAPGDPRHLSRRHCRQGELHADHRLKPSPELRKGDRKLRRPRRKGGRPG